MTPSEMRQILVAFAVDADNELLNILRQARSDPGTAFDDAMASMERRLAHLRTLERRYAGEQPSSAAEVERLRTATAGAEAIVADNVRLEAERDQALARVVELEAVVQRACSQDSNMHWHCPVHERCHLCAARHAPPQPCTRVPECLLVANHLGDCVKV